MQDTKNNPSNFSGSNWWYASALGIFCAFFGVMHLLFLEWPFSLPVDQGARPFERGFRITNSIMAGLMVLMGFAIKGMKVDRTANRVRQVAAGVVLLVFLGIYIETWREYRGSAGAMVEDVGNTSLAADRLLVRGENPYASKVDPQGQSGVSRFDGYKYLPVTLAAYFPAAVWFRDGDQGILETNLILSILAAGALGRVVWKEISLDAGVVCAGLFFMSEVVTYETVVKGTNDIVPMLLLILALCNVERRFVCGLLVGLAISAKFLPGLLWVSILLVPRGNRRFAAGVGVGLLPCLPFLLWGPGAMIDNVIVFVLGKPWHPSAPLYYSPVIVRGMVQAAVAGVWGAVGFYALRNRLDGVRRCALAAGLTLAFELASPMVHQNYFVWWHAPLCVVVAGVMFNPGSYQWIGNGNREGQRQ